MTEQKKTNESITLSKKQQHSSLSTIKFFNPHIHNE